jgi:hypothetical protein
MNWQLRALRYYAIGTTALLVVVALDAFRGNPRMAQVDEITARRVNLIDSAGRVRVMLAGSFPPRRSEYAGLLFVNDDGMEAGGLTYRGHRSVDGTVVAGGVITMDQYAEDQVVVLQYNQHGVRKQEGLTISDRPDTMGQALRTLYQVLDTFPPSPKRDSVQRALIAHVPTEQLPARRVFVGRDTSRNAVLSLADRQGIPRLRLAVDSLGRASIVFLDPQGRATRTIIGGP